MAETKFHIASDEEGGQFVTTVSAEPPFTPREAERISNDLQRHTEMGDGVDHTFDSGGTELTIRVDREHKYRENPVPAMVGAVVTTTLRIRGQG